MHSQRSDELSERVSRLNERYRIVTGKTVENFFCPILLKDIPGELCRGHVIPANLRISGTWVPQRADVDSFFGRTTEAVFGTAMNHAEKSPTEIWLNKDANQIFKPQLKHKDELIEHFFVPADAKIKISERHCLGDFLNGDGETISRFVIKKTKQELRALCGEPLEVVLESDLSPQVAASIIKAAHLTLFYLSDYNFALSPGGRFLSSVLSRFYEDAQHLPNADIQGILKKRFSSRECSMIFPMQRRSGERLAGSLTSKVIIACLAANRSIFAFGVLVETPSQTFCVFIPGEDGDLIDTYFSFISEPAPSIQAKFLQLQYSDSPRWNIDLTPPQTIPLVQLRPD